MKLPLLFHRPRNPLFYLLLWVPYVAVYQLTNRFPLVAPNELAYGLIDRLIPYAPALMLVYLLYFPLYWWTAIRSESDEVAVRLFYAAYFQLTVSVLFFVLFPVRMPTEVLTQFASPGFGAAFWHWFDGPNNCFPSLHAANGLLLLHFNWHRSARLFHTVLAAGVVISTVFVKQHYVIDLVGGAGVYLLTVAFLQRLTIGSAIAASSTRACRFGTSPNAVATIPSMIREVGVRNDESRLSGAPQRI